MNVTEITQKSTREAVVLSYRRFPDGGISPGEKAGLVRNVGDDVIVGVDGKSTLNKTFGEVVMMLKQACSRASRTTAKTVKLRFAALPLRRLLRDPMWIIRMGGVEENGIFRGKTEAQMTTYLIRALYAQPEPSVFEYLLSLEGVNCNCGVPTLLNSENEGPASPSSCICVLACGSRSPPNIDGT